MPRTPDYMRGVINLRGSVVPVLDMRMKFNLSMVEKTVDTCIIVAEVFSNGESIVLGALVDSVQEVFELEPSQIEPPPKIGTGLRTECIKGMGKRDDKFIIVLDIDKVFSADELEIADGAGEAKAMEALESAA